MKPGGHEEMGELNVERSQSVLGQGWGIWFYRQATEVIQELYPGQISPTEEIMNPDGGRWKLMWLNPGEIRGAPVLGKESWARGDRAGTENISEGESIDSGKMRTTEDFSFDLCPQTGWGWQEEVEVVSGYNRTLERKTAAQYRGWKGKLQDFLSRRLLQLRGATGDVIIRTTKYEISK